MRLKLLFGISVFFLTVGSFAQEGTTSCVTVPESVGPHSVAPMDFKLVVRLGCAFTAYELKVSDASGKVVFKTTDSAASWDAKDATPGTYFWEITGTTQESTSRFAEKGKFVVVD